jgi:NAD(P)H dehydrogenase (quinone)
MTRRLLPKIVAVLSIVAALAFFVSLVYAADPTAVSVLVVYHSASGNTEKMAQGVVDGAKAVSGVNVVLKRAAEVGANDLLSSDALIVGSPVLRLPRPSEG